MCIEDIRLQRKSISAENIRSIGTSAAHLIGPSELRTALVIGCPLSGRITISPNPGVTDGNGIVLNALGSPLVLDLQHHGAMVTHGLYAVHSATTVSVAVWETSLEEK